MQKGMALLEACVSGLATKETAYVQRILGIQVGRDDFAPPKRPAPTLETPRVVLRNEGRKVRVPYQTARELIPWASATPSGLQPGGQRA